MISNITDSNYIKQWQEEFLLEIEDLADAVEERDACDNIPCSSTVNIQALAQLQLQQIALGQQADRKAAALEGSLYWLSRELAVTQSMLSLLPGNSRDYAEQAIELNRFESLTRSLAGAKVNRDKTIFDLATEVLSRYAIDHNTYATYHAALAQLAELALDYADHPPLTWAYSPISVSIRIWDESSAEAYMTTHSLFSVFAFATNNTEQEMRDAILGRPAKANGLTIFRRLAEISGYSARKTHEE